MGAWASAGRRVHAKACVRHGVRASRAQTRVSACRHCACMHLPRRSGGRFVRVSIGAVERALVRCVCVCVCVCTRARVFECVRPAGPARSDLEVSRPALGRGLTDRPQNS